MIYHHFGDRSTLLQNALEHIGNRADGYTQARGGDGRTMVIEILLGEIQDIPAVRTNSAAWGELRGQATFDPALRPLLAQLTQRWAVDVTALIRIGVADGSIPRTASAQQLGVQLTAAVEGISARWLTEQLSTARARTLLRSLIELLLGPRP